MPLLVLMGAVALIGYGSWEESRAAADIEDVTRLVRPHTAVVHTLQTERRVAVEVASGTAEPSELDLARRTTDMAMSKFNIAIAATPEGLLDGRISDLRSSVVQLATSLPAMRTQVAGAPATVVDSVYTEMILSLAAMPAMVADQISAADLGPVLRTYATLLVADEWLVHELALAGAVLAAPEVPADAAGQLAGLVSTTNVELASARDALTRIGEPGLVTPPTDEESLLRASLGSGVPSLIASVDATAYLNAADGHRDELRAAERAVVDRIMSDATAAASAAQRQMILTIAAGAAAVLLSLVVGVVLARRITRPLRRLTRAAAQVRDELPRLVEQVAVPGQVPDMSIAEIPVSSSDEVGRLAAAFNEANSTTLRAAQEQAALRGSIAEMFVNVARRDQVLLNRQLTFIDALERSEEDPKVLADLFRLDHLATRMRRNAESLLVLAGIDTGRRLRDTLPLSDVVRTASSEIEHYERVVLELPIDPLMLGHTALPAAHLIAELLENATMFSEPGSPVHVSTGRDETHVVITVVDQGLGMSADEIEQSHAKIRSSSPSEVLGAQRLGFFVVGRIAARLGAQVELSAGPYGTGTMATVRLPLVLFVDVADVPLATPTLPPAATDHPVVLG
ncbi:MAG TPA: nitrate- and nitrite sensing domain-containing protein, partial [Actinotalea sp.]|nr:nitrate- and nitrite sensing domain-containing protein [Actinotalea sp.]